MAPKAFRQEDIGQLLSPLQPGAFEIKQESIQSALLGLIAISARLSLPS